jgi:DNA-damage-inducible protein D
VGAEGWYIVGELQTEEYQTFENIKHVDKDSKRLVVRGDVRHWNLMLASAAHRAGLVSDEEYAVFQNAGYKGLYGGLTVADIHQRKNLDKGEKILDHMGSEELATNLFRITQTESKG